MRRGLASGRQSGCGLRVPQKSVLWVWGAGGACRLLSLTSEAAEGARDQQQLKLWQMLYRAADESLELGNVLGPIFSQFFMVAIPLKHS